MRISAFLLVCLAWLSVPLSYAQLDDPFASATIANQDEFLPVEEAYQLNSEFTESGKLRLNWQIADAYYLYRHSFKFLLLKDGEPLDVETAISPGLAKNDEYFGDVEVYYHYADVDLANIPKDASLSLAVTSQGCADAGLCYPPRTQYLKLDGTSLQSKEVAAPAQAPGTPAQNNGNKLDLNDSNSLWLAIVFALLGGAILNLMPCVFPVLSLKVLGFASDKQHSQALHGLSYTAGVVLSFIAVAGLMISLRAAGEAVGWGFQLQTPWFVAALTYLFFVMGLSLSGFVEFGGRWMGFGDKLAASSGYNGSFFTGVLATVVASPCTAPFMGSALGYAVNQSAFTALSVFAALGFGMALPVLLLSYSPKLLEKLPKPGPWMDTLKQFLAFPLYGAALWLVWVVGKQTGVNGMLAVLVGCLLLTLALWLWQRHLVSRLIAAASAALAIGLLSSSILTAQIDRQPQSEDWQAYSPATLKELRARGEPVFVNLTADWCITCLANERLTLSTDAVKQAFNAEGINYLKGDWTNYDPQITALLEQHQRSGVPLYLLYPPGQEPIILPQLLTQDIVLDALNHL